MWNACHFATFPCSHGNDFQHVNFPHFMMEYICTFVPRMNPSSSCITVITLMKICGVHAILLKLHALTTVHVMRLFYFCSHFTTEIFITRENQHPMYQVQCRRVGFMYSVPTPCSLLSCISTLHAVIKKILLLVLREAFVGQR